MKKFLALIAARNKEFYRDHGTLGWTLLFPFIVLAGFAYGYSGRQEPVLRFLVVPAQVLESSSLKGLKEIPGLNFLPIADETAALKKLERFECDLVISKGQDS